MEAVFHPAAGPGWAVGVGALTVGLGFLHVWLGAGVPPLLTYRGTRVVPLGQVPEALDHDRPVCWNSHIAETFRREHSNLVVDRPARDPARHQQRV